MEKNKVRIQYITRAALFTAVLIVFQYLTAGFTQLVTGSLVNLVLVLSAMLGGKALKGYGVGGTVALLSPVFAKLLGIGPLWSIIPGIMLGNLTVVLVWRLVAGGGFGRRHSVLAKAVAIIAGAVAKFLVLYLVVVVVLLPLLGLPEPAVATISATFSLPQLFTALIGGGVAFVVLLPLQRALGENNI